MHCFYSLLLLYLVSYFSISTPPPSLGLSRQIQLIISASPNPKTLGQDLAAAKQIPLHVSNMHRKRAVQGATGSSVLQGKYF